jgi:hypothetical protein
MDKNQFVQVLCLQMASMECCQYSNNGKNTFGFYLACWNLEDMSCKKSNGGNLCSSLCHQDKTHLPLFGSIANCQNPTSSLNTLVVLCAFNQEKLVVARCIFFKKNEIDSNSNVRDPRHKIIKNKKIESSFP